MAVEFTVTLEDRPGALAQLTEVLARNAINIVAIHATPCPAQGIVQFITDNTDGTIGALKEAEEDYITQEVLLINAAHEPGSLARITRALGDAGININALYITMTGQIVLDVDNLTGAQRVLLALGTG